MSALHDRRPPRARERARAEAEIRALAGPTIEHCTARPLELRPATAKALAGVIRAAARQMGMDPADVTVTFCPHRSR